MQLHCAAPAQRLEKSIGLQVFRDAVCRIAANLSIAGRTDLGKPPGSGGVPRIDGGDTRSLKVRWDTVPSRCGHVNGATVLRSQTSMPKELRQDEIEQAVQKDMDDARQGLKIE